MVSAIEWTDATWNPTRGCSRVSPGCEHCYAETMAARIVRMGGKAAAAYRSPVKRDPKGGDPSEWPKDLRVREWPETNR